MELVMDVKSLIQIIFPQEKNTQGTSMWGPDQKRKSLARLSGNEVPGSRAAAVNGTRKPQGLSRGVIVKVVSEQDHIEYLCIVVEFYHKRFML